MRDVCASLRVCALSMQRLGVNDNKRKAPHAVLPSNKATKVKHESPSVATPAMQPHGMGKPMAGMGKPTYLPGAVQPPQRRSDPPADKGKKGKKNEPSPVHSPASSTAGSTLDVEHLEEVAHEQQYMQIISEGAELELSGDNASPDELPLPGMHIVTDLTREDDPFGCMLTIPTTQGPEPTNVATVVKVHEDGSCDAQLLSDERGHQPGKLLKRVQPPQRQIACSCCFNVELPFALPQLRCS